MEVRREPGVVFWLVLGVVVAGVLLLRSCDGVLPAGARFEATACAQGRGTAIGMWVAERSERQVLGTRVGELEQQAVCTPDAELDAKLGALETMVAGLAGVLCAEQTPTDTGVWSPVASATWTPRPLPTTAETQTTRPTWTVDPVLFTPTATSTPDPLCLHCSETNQACPEPWNFYCRECRAEKWRCVRRSMPASDCEVCMREGVD